MQDEEQLGLAFRTGELLYKHLVGEINNAEIEELYCRPEDAKLIGELSDPVVLRRLIDDLAAYDAAAAFKSVQEQLQMK
jgi:hypothetical protein